MPAGLSPRFATIGKIAFNGIAGLLQFGEYQDVPCRTAREPNKCAVGCTDGLYRVVYQAGTNHRERDVCCMLLAPPSLRVSGARVAKLRDL